jgi:hypothetical protein
VESSSGADVLAQEKTAARCFNRVDRLILVLWQAQAGFETCCYHVNLRSFFIRLVIPLFAIVLVIVVLAIVMPLFCLLGSVASYRRARHRRAMLSPSQRLCQVIVVLRADTGLLSAVFQPLRTLSSIRSSSNSSAILQEEWISLGGFG